jgi:hypothetical protein
VVVVSGAGSRAEVVNEERAEHREPPLLEVFVTLESAL